MLSLIRKFWHTVTATKNAVGNIVFLILLALIIAGIFSAETPQIASSTALVINPTGIIVDQKQVVDPFSEFLTGYEEEAAETLQRDIIEAIDTASEDNRIKALVLDLHAMRGASMSKLEEISISIEKFKTTGKPVYAFARRYNQAQYYVASHADKIYIDKQDFGGFGGVFLTGIGVYPTYFKDALDKLKITFHIFKAGLYKGAVEPFIRNDMSEEAKTANSGWIGVLWTHYRDTIVKQRGISIEDFEQYTTHYDQMLGNDDIEPAGLAVNQGLVDAILTREEWLEQMRALVGKSKSSYNHVTLNNYLLATRPPIETVEPGKRKIAVIIASGTIYDGEQPPGQIGGDSMAKLIRDARKDTTIQAIVVRIDSPGGSASASELIRSELAIAQDEGIPVVVSMSGYAASGGYWIASTANKIFSANTTVTGSIGVFAIFPTFEEGLAELGIRSDGVGTTALSGSFNSFKAINPLFENLMQTSVARTYNRFVSLVAEGREQTVEEIDRIAQGRIWAGATAIELGLVDAVGSLNDAIDSAAVLADLTDYDVIYLEKELTTKEKLIQQMMSSSLEGFHAISGGFSQSWTKIFTAPARVPAEISRLLEMSRAPGTYLQCVACEVRY